MFVSTRNKKDLFCSKEAIIKGLADDGGLYVPKEIKKIDLSLLKGLSYQDLSFEIISHVFDDLNREELKKIIYDSYSTNFDDEEITPLKKINNKYLLELFHGPTSAFKDIALQFLPRIMTMLNDDGKDIVILTATSGDTGKAALEGFKNVKGSRIVVLYPYKMVSTIQERQMTTTKADNVEVMAVKGNFDDCQKMIKEIFEDCHFDNIHLTSANSINIARLIPQCVYYFKAYFDLLKQKEIKENEKISFIVPTGNFGDILAAYLAKEMGLPIDKLVVASNANNVLTDFINTGIYDANRPFYNTISPSIDILISSNLERLLYLVCKDSETVASLMNDLKKNRKYSISKEMLEEIQKSFLAYDASEAECREVIKKYYDKYYYLADTHTAVALVAAEKYQTDSKQVVLATASPFKFSKDVYKALCDSDIDDDLNAMNILANYCGLPVPKNLAELKDLKVIFEDSIDVNDKETIINKLKEF